jgi:thymidine phosphorylase
MIPFIKILDSLKNESPTSFDHLIDFSESMITKKEISQLAFQLAKSGNILNLNKSDKVLADIPSTGGPSSLSTLLTPLFLRLLGYKVPKLGVPGRPAGGIDVLAQIEGYDINPNLTTLKDWLHESDYVHFVGGDNYAPLDMQLFKYRKARNKIGVPALVVASILSKKIAVGLQTTGLDIRVSEFGNFGSDWESAKKNAQLFIDVASLVDIKATCFLTNANKPFQPYIGRGEALLALREIFSGNGDNNGWLMSHLTECYAMSVAIGETTSISDAPRLKIPPLYDFFLENLELQGGSTKHFFTLTDKIKNEHIYELLSEKSGFVTIDIFKLRSAIIEMQSRFISELEFPDPCGIILSVQNGDFVEESKRLCTFRCDKSLDKEFTKLIKEAIFTSEKRRIPYDFQEIRL